ncbi:MAG: hypothetical protein PSX37_04970 [bacterium]|nr:hypothetical protein [bacterium]
MSSGIFNTTALSGIGTGASAAAGLALPAALEAGAALLGAVAGDDSLVELLLHAAVTPIAMMTAVAPT